MNIANIKFLIVATVLTLTTSFLLADQIVLKNGKNFTTLVSGINASEVKTEKKNFLIKDIKRVVFSSADIPAKKSGIILKDGTLLTGVIRKSDKKELQFRSTTFGLITVSLQEIAVIFQDGSRNVLKKLKTIKIIPAVIKADGSELNGKILWNDLTSVGILGSNGLKKVPYDKIAIISYSKFSDKVEFILRNGDQLQKSLDKKDNKIKFKFGELSLRAVKIYQP